MSADKTLGHGTSPYFRGGGCLCHEILEHYII